MKQSKPKMMLFIPAYNCEKQIIRVLNQLDDEVLSYFDEVLVVNNRSRRHSIMRSITAMNMYVCCMAMIREISMIFCRCLKKEFTDSMTVCLAHVL